MKNLLSSLALATLLATVGCGSGDSASDAAPAPAKTAAPAKAPAPAPAPAAAPTEQAAPADSPAQDNALAGANVENGKTVYNTNCLACHQSDGTGMGGALGADLVNDKTRWAKSDTQLLKSITDGIEGTTMIAWSAILDEQQRKDVLAYIRATYMK